MLNVLSYYWRVFATGLSFALFGLGGLLLRLVVFPLMQVLVVGQERRRLAARAVVRWAFRVYIEMMRALGVLTYEVRGIGKLDRGGLLILANHPTLIDTIFLMAFVRRADCIVKAELWNNPFTRGPVRAAGYVVNSAGPEIVSSCLATLDAGNNLIVFPEGTRTGSDGVLRMKRGAANIAVRGARDITPVVIRCEPATLGKGEKWWKVPGRAVRFTLDVQDDLPVREFIGDAGGEALAARHLTGYLENYFTGRCQQNA
ncbi:MAG TPA: lysophospholipid acyltransferase family protein [Telluria sp.]